MSAPTHLPVRVVEIIAQAARECAQAVEDRNGLPADSADARQNVDRLASALSTFGQGIAAAMMAALPEVHGEKHGPPVEDADPLLSFLADIERLPAGQYVTLRTEPAEEDPDLRVLTLVRFQGEKDGLSRDDDKVICGLSAFTPKDMANLIAIGGWRKP